MAYKSEHIIPAIMPKSFEHLEAEMTRFIGIVPLVQIDVMDGKFVPSRSWPYGKDLDRQFLKIVNQEIGFPLWEELDTEIDLMVSNPAEAADQWIATGAARIIVHYESAAPVVIASVLSSIKEKGIESGLAVGLETPIGDIELFYEKNQEKIDLIQCMGIAKIGYQGEPFDERVLNRIAKLRAAYPHLMISVDGGVSDDTVEDLFEAGVSRLVAGSALGDDSDVEKTIEHFEQFLKIP